MKKTGITVVITLLIIFSISRIPLIQYAWMQGSGQLKILTGAIGFDEFINSKESPDKLKKKLKLVKEAIVFAETIGLNTEKAYSTIYDQKGEDVLWNVSACKPYFFESYRWHFPILGSFSYKGFFDLEAAKLEASRLEAKGLDVSIRPVGAWSTLGWFHDPLMSKQLEKNDFRLVETIFHELTHATLFFKDSLSLNENLASFIGEKAAFAFLLNRSGLENDTINLSASYQTTEMDSRIYRNHMLQGKSKLDSLYRSFDENTIEAMRKKKKNDLILEIIQSLDTLQFRNPGYYEIFSEDALPNNAYFMGISLYNEDYKELERLLMKYDDDLRKFIQAMREDPISKIR